jgi:hypothetical protein
MAPTRDSQSLKVNIPKQVEFKGFCQKKQYCDADTVNEEKLLLFLTECVIHRPHRTRWKCSDRAPQAHTRLAWRSVRGYVTAITDLYRTQKALGMNSNPSPREDTVRRFIKSLQAADAARKKAQYADKGRDTLLDGYPEQQLEAVCASLWQQDSQSQEIRFRTLVDILLGHYMLIRGGDRRSA